MQSSQQRSLYQSLNPTDKNFDFQQWVRVVKPQLVEALRRRNSSFPLG